MLLQRRCASDYSVAGWRNVMTVTKNAVSRYLSVSHEASFRKKRIMLK